MMVYAGDVYPVEAGQEPDMGMVCAGDLHPVKVGQEHGHGLCRRSLSCRSGPGA